MVYMKQNIIAYKKFTCQQKYASQFERKKSKKVKIIVVFGLQSSHVIM